MPTYRYIPIVAAAHTPPYKIHKYFARRPHNVFEQLIENFSDENELVLDPFCGGGVTIYEGLRKGRKVIGCDINPLSIFVVGNMIEKDCCNTIFNNVVDDLTKYIEELYGTSQEIKHGDTTFKILWYELCFEARCPQCGCVTPLSSQTKQRDGWYFCSNEFCEHHLTAYKAAEVRRCGYRYLYASVAEDHTRKYIEVPSEHLGILKKHIAHLKQELVKKSITVPQDVIPINWDRQFEDGLSKKGILYFQDFFTKRNLYILLLLKHKIDSFKGYLTNSQYNLLRLAFSNTLKETNVMSFTNDGWQGGKPTTWSKHAYWIPNQFCETNIVDAFKGSIERVRKSVAYNDSYSYVVKRARDFKDLILNSNIFLFNGSVVNSGITENSVDAIITDPPYGSNVQYLELSHFWYPWNKDLYGVEPDFTEEAVSNRKKGFQGAKDQYSYEINLYKVFCKAYEVLKPNRYMTLTFNNKDMSSWLGLLFSIFRAGFSFHDIYFQDGVGNYKQTAHTKAKGSPYGDFIYVFKKSTPDYELKDYKYEQDFINDLDALFQRELSSNRSRNDIILDMMRNAVPLIDGFAKQLPNIGEHNVYRYFPKNYLEKLYK